MPRELKVDPSRLTALQRRVDAMRGMARGLMNEVYELNRRRDLAAAHLLHLKRRWQQWEATRSVPAGIRHPAEAGGIEAMFNTPAIAVADTESQIAQLDTELSIREEAHAALQLRLRPLAELTMRCERFLGRAPVVLHGSLPRGTEVIEPAPAEGVPHHG